jgi:hydrogenase 3 maturation protease
LSFLKGYSKLALVGIGNRMRKDDAVGVRVVTGLKGKVPSKVEIFDCGTAPENFIPAIRRSEPSHAIFFDAVDMGAEPGFYRFIDEETLVSGSVSTHKQSLKMLFMVLRGEMECINIRLVGVQPKNLEFGEGLTAPLNRSLNLLRTSLVKAVVEGEK